MIAVNFTHKYVCVHCLLLLIQCTYIEISLKLIISEWIFIQKYKIHGK